MGSSRVSVVFIFSLRSTLSVLLTALAALGAPPAGLVKVSLSYVQVAPTGEFHCTCSSFLERRCHLNCIYSLRSALLERSCHCIPQLSAAVGGRRRPSV